MIHSLSPRYTAPPRVQQNTQRSGAFGGGKQLAKDLAVLLDEGLGKNSDPEEIIDSIKPIILCGSDELHF